MPGVRFWVPLAFCACVAVAHAQTGKWVVIDKTQQVLRAYEGRRLVLETRVSTGRWNGATPNGEYTAGDKFRMHYSRRYHNAPMPWSVQVNGHMFIHGFTSVPRYPASHGCIRLPRSFAKKLYNLTDFGSTTVVVTNKKARSSDEALGAA